MSKKILFMSDSPFLHTGYAKSTKNVADYFYKNTEYKIAYFGWGDWHFENYNITYPIYSTLIDHRECCGEEGRFIRKATKDDLYYMDVTKDGERVNLGCKKGKRIKADEFGQHSLEYVVDDFNPDILIAQGDYWMLNYVNEIHNRYSFYYIAYPAIDAEPIPKHIDLGGRTLDVIKFLKKCDDVIPFTQWSKNNINDRIDGLCDTYIPLSIDNNVYEKLDKRAELKRNFFNLDDEKSFIISVVARNQPRKCWARLFLGLKKFINKYEEDRKVYIYAHTTKDDSGILHDDFLDDLGIKDRVIYNSDLKITKGVSEEKLNEYYNACDCNALLFTSEGFCPKEDCIVHTDNGYRYIQDVDTSDTLFTHVNRFKSVTTFSEHENKNTYLVSTDTVPNFYVDDENVFLTEEGYKNVKDLDTDDFLLYPKNTFNNKLENYPVGDLDADSTFIQEEIPDKLLNTRVFYEYPAEIPLNRDSITDFAHFFMIGEIIDGGIAFPKEHYEKIYDDYSFDPQNFLEYFSIDNVVYQESKLYHKFYHPLVQQLFSDFLYKEHKILPGIFKSLPNKHKQKFVFSLYENYVKRDTLKVGSDIMAMNLIEIFQSLRFPYTYNDKVFSFKETSCKHDDRYAYIPIKNIEMCSEKKNESYKLTIKEDNSFTINGIVSQNCLPLAEGASAGLVTISSNYSAPSSWGKEHLLFVDNSDFTYEPRTNLKRAVPDIDDFVEQLKKVYFSEVKPADFNFPKLRTELSIDNIGSQWKEVVDNIEFTDYELPKLYLYGYIYSKSDVKTLSRIKSYFEKEDMNIQLEIYDPMNLSNYGNLKHGNFSIILNEILKKRSDSFYFYEYHAIANSKTLSVMRNYNYPVVTLPLYNPKKDIYNYGQRLEMGKFKNLREPGDSDFASAPVMYINPEKLETFPNVAIDSIYLGAYLTYHNDFKMLNNYHIKYKRSKNLPQQTALSDFIFLRSNITGSSTSPEAIVLSDPKSLLYGINYINKYATDHALPVIVPSIFSWMIDANKIVVKNKRDVMQKMYSMHRVILVNGMSHKYFQHIFGIRKELDLFHVDEKIHIYSDFDKVNYKEHESGDYVAAKNIQYVANDINFVPYSSDLKNMNLNIDDKFENQERQEIGELI